MSDGPRSGRRKPLRVGYLVKRYPRLSETFILQEILEHERQGTRVLVLSLKKPDEGRFHADVASVRARVMYLPGSVLSRLAKVVPANLRRFRASPRRYLTALALALQGGDRHALRAFLIASEVASIAEKRKLEHLHAHFATGATYTAMLVSTLTGIPFSFTAHARDLFGDHVDRRALRRKVRSSAFVVTVSRHTQAFLRSVVDESDRFRVLMIHNGVRPDLLRNPPPPTSRRGLPLVLGVGRLVPKKGFVLLLEAAARLHASGARFRIAILGDGPQRRELEARARELGLPVRFLGAQPHHRTLGVLARARLLALPCVVDGESDRDVLPTVLLEAQALAKPIVTTPIGGIEDIVTEGEGGHLVEPGDAQALASAIHRLLENPDRARDMGLAGRTRMERDFEIRRSVRQLRYHFARAAGRPRASVSGAPVEGSGGTGPVSAIRFPGAGAPRQVVNS